MTEFENAIYELDLYGFTVVERVLTSDQIATMREVLVRLNDEVGEERAGEGSCSHVSNLPTLDPIFFPIIDHPRILPILEHYLEPTLILGSLNSRIVRPGDGDQGFHSDIPAEMLNMASPVMMNTVWMLDDFTPEIGATRIVPGTHKSGINPPPENVEMKHVLTATAPAGSVLVFNGQCWHGGGGNTSDRNRHAIFGHYRIGPMMRFQLDPHHHFPAEWLDLLTDRQKQLLRMEEGVGVLHGADHYE